MRQKRHVPKHRNAQSRVRTQFLRGSRWNYSNVLKYRNSITQNDKLQSQITSKLSPIQKLHRGEAVRNGKFQEILFQHFQKLKMFRDSL